jgi:hypothetical protein
MDGNMRYVRNDDEWDSLVSYTLPIVERLATNEDLTDYTGLNLELADQLGHVPFDFSLERDRVAVGAVLADVVLETHARVNAMLSAVVKYMHDNDPGPGFYRFAESRHWMARGEDHLTFWSNEVKKLYDHFAAPQYNHYRNGRPSRREPSPGHR